METLFLNAAAEKRVVVHADFIDSLCLSLSLYRLAPPFPYR